MLSWSLVEGIRIHFDVHWLIEQARTIAKNADVAVPAGAEPLPARWWIEGDAERSGKAWRKSAGIGSPLHEAMVERLASELARELEAAAMAKLAERERLASERKAAKAT